MQTKVCHGKICDQPSEDYLHMEVVIQPTMLNIIVNGSNIVY
jgi:hypothetical protein